MQTHGGLVTLIRIVFVAVAWNSHAQECFTGELTQEHCCVPPLGRLSCWQQPGLSYEVCCLGDSVAVDACGCAPGSAWHLQKRRCLEANTPHLPDHLVRRCNRFRRLVMEAAAEPAVVHVFPAWQNMDNLADPPQGQWLREEHGALVQDYVTAVRLAVQSPAEFARFRRQGPRYSNVLEHAGLEEARRQLEHLRTRFLPLYTHIAQWKMSDIVGTPLLNDFGGHVGAMSTTTVRYVAVLGDILTAIMTFAEPKRSATGEAFEGWDVAEIGGGYGGQALALHLAMPHLRSYTIFDLPVVGQLQKRFLQHFPNVARKTIFATLDDLRGQHFDLCLSNFAYSELSEELQRLYTESLFMHCDRGFVLDNHFALDTREAPDHSRDEALDAWRWMHDANYSVFIERDPERWQSPVFEVFWVHEENYNQIVEEGEIGNWKLFS